MVIFGVIESIQCWFWMYIIQYTIKITEETCSSHLVLFLIYCMYQLQVHCLPFAVCCLFFTRVTTRQEQQQRLSDSYLIQFNSSHDTIYVDLLSMSSIITILLIWSVFDWKKREWQQAWLSRSFSLCDKTTTTTTGYALSNLNILYSNHHQIYRLPISYSPATHYPIYYYDSPLW